MAYDTKVSAEKTSSVMKKSGRFRSIAARRASPPEIFVKCVDRAHPPWRDPYDRAHLRNRKGYVYLTWRDGERVRSFYLGKRRANPLRRTSPGPPATWSQLVELDIPVGKKGVKRAAISLKLRSELP